MLTDTCPQWEWWRRGGCQPCTQWGVLTDKSLVGMEGGEEDLNHICSGRCSVKHVPSVGGGGGSVPCTHRRMLRDTYPYTAMSSEGDIH